MPGKETSTNDKTKSTDRPTREAFVAPLTAGLEQTVQVQQELFAASRRHHALALSLLREGLDAWERTFERLSADAEKASTAATGQLAAALDKARAA